MRYFTLAVLIVIAAGIGVLVGTLLAEPSGTTLAVATQTREDQVTIFAQSSAAGSDTDIGNKPNYRRIGNQDSLIRLAFNAGRYPQSASFQFEVTWMISGDASRCVRLYDATTQSGVQGSEICFTPEPGAETQRLRTRSEAMTLLAEQHEYGIQGKCTGGVCGSLPRNVSAARIIVEWAEPVSQVAQLPGTGGGDIAELRRDQPASDSPLPVGASVAIGLLVMGAGGLYAVKMRRG